MIATILISSKNRCDALRDTLAALDRVERPEGLSTEILIVDNASTDATQDLLKSTRLQNFPIRSLFEREGGKSRALNTGIAEARGEIIVLIDDDIRPQADWLEKITERIVAGDCDAVAGTVRIAPHLLRPWMRPLHRAWLASTELIPVDAPDCSTGANMSFSRRILKSVPGFDLKLGPGPGCLGQWEDTLFSMQIKEAGFRLGMAPAAVVEHHFDAKRLSRSSFYNRALAEARSSAYVKWHWMHEPVSGIAAQYLDLNLRLFLKRLLRWRQWRQPEGMPEWEMNCVMGLEFNRRFLAERRRRHLYEKRGTKKLEND